MILLPSRGRPGKAKRFFEAYHATQASMPGLLMIEERDRNAYADVRIPANWDRVIVDESLVSKKVNDAAFRFASGESCYLIMADDCVPETEHWDRKLAVSAGVTGIAYGNDLMDPAPPIGHPCLGGELVRALGWIAAPGFGHFYWDNVLRDIAEGLGVLTYRPEVITRHLHYTVTSDSDVFERGHPINDKHIYAEWRRNDKQRDIERVRKALFPC